MSSSPAHKSTEAPEEPNSVRLLVSTANEVVGLNGDTSLISEQDIWGSRIADLFDEGDQFINTLRHSERDDLDAKLKTIEGGRWLFARGQRIRGQLQIECSVNVIADRVEPGAREPALSPPLLTTHLMAAQANPGKVTNLRAVLCVDDEAMILRVYRRMFAESVTVYTASSVDEAVQLLEDHDEIDAILCDVMLPGKSGYELFHRVDHAYPRLSKRFAFVSGGVIDPTLEAMIDKTGVPFCSKPFTGRDIKSVIAEIIRRADSGGTDD